MKKILLFVFIFCVSIIFLSCKDPTEENYPQGFVFANGVTIKGTESWYPKTKVFINERVLSIPDLLVCDHEVTRGEYKSLMEIDPSTADAYDKDGNKLTGDVVLNNPVDSVSWYDAIVYCNKLSIKEKLTPCYSINDSTNPVDWEKFLHQVMEHGMT